MQVVAHEEVEQGLLAILVVLQHRGAVQRKQLAAGITAVCLLGASHCKD